LDVSLTPVLSKNVASLEDVTLEFYLGDDLGISSVRCEVSRGLGGFGSGGNVSEDGPGAWSYSPKTRILHWEIGSAESAATWVLKGWWTVTPDTTPRPARALQVTFAAPKSTFSALKVDQLRVNVEGYKPYKGVRGRSMGRIEWRV
jgi:AP-3 complex subunit mu